MWDVNYVPQEQADEYGIPFRGTSITFFRRRHHNPTCDPGWFPVNIMPFLPVTGALVFLMAIILFPKAHQQWPERWRIALTVLPLILILPVLVWQGAHCALIKHRANRWWRREPRGALVESKARIELHGLIVDAWQVIGEDKYLASRTKMWACGGLNTLNLAAYTLLVVFFICRSIGLVPRAEVLFAVAAGGMFWAAIGAFGRSQLIVVSADRLSIIPAGVINRHIGRAQSLTLRGSIISIRFDQDELIIREPSGNRAVVPFPSVGRRHAFAREVIERATAP